MNAWGNEKWLEGECFGLVTTACYRDKILGQRLVLKEDYALR